MPKPCKPLVVNGENWVTERANCTVAKVFELLRLQVTHDVEARNALESRPKPSFSMGSDGDSFFVVDERSGQHQSVIFSKRQTAILVRDGKDVVMFHAIPTPSDEGECRLTIDYGNERKEGRQVWQVSRSALERMFFETSSTRD